MTVIVKNLEFDGVFYEFSKTLVSILSQKRVKFWRTPIEKTLTKSGLYCSIRRAKTETEEEQKEASLGTPRSEGKTFVYF